MYFIGMLLPFGRARLVVSPNPTFVLELWAYATLCTNIVDTKVDVSKTDSTSMDTVKIDGDSLLVNCTF